jgi:hypothetical protein
MVSAAIVASSVAAPRTVDLMWRLPGSMPFAHEPNDPEADALRPLRRTTNRYAPPLMAVERSFPSLLRDASDFSARGQRLYMRLTYGGLLAALVAAVGGAIPVEATVGSATVDVGSAVAGLAFLVGIGLAYYTVSIRPERGWYEGRAVAASIKTLCWQYGVGGGVFGVGAAEAEERLIGRLGEVLESTGGLTLAAGGPLITAELSALRREPLAARRAVYLAERVDGQVRWYSGRAAYNRSRVHLWYGVAIACQAAGLAFAALKAFDVIQVDLLGIAATAAASASAWVQAKDHQGLAESYAVTTRELVLIRAKAEAAGDAVDEADWCAYVEDAERAISREHTLWLARRGAQGG